MCPARPCPYVQPSCLCICYAVRVSRPTVPAVLCVCPGPQYLLCFACVQANSTCCAVRVSRPTVPAVLCVCPGQHYLLCCACVQANTICYAVRVSRPTLSAVLSVCPGSRYLLCCACVQAYSIYDEEIGYCQGFSFIAASVLLHVSGA